MRVANQAHKRDVRTIVRTAFNLAGSEARKAVNAANSDVLIGERLVVTLDSRTSVTCYGLSVITSYSIHYTKLYELKISQSQRYQ